MIQISQRRQAFALGGFVLLVVIVGVVPTSPVVAQSDAVEENEVDIEGSTITVSTGGANAIAVEDLPRDVTISDVSDSGVFNEDRRSILYTDLGDGLPATVTFSLNPDDDAYTPDSDEVSFTVGDDSVSLDIVGQSDNTNDGSSNNDADDESNDESTNGDGGTEEDNQADENNDESVDSDIDQQADDSETVAEDDNNAVSVEEAVEQVAETEPDTRTEVTIEDTDEETEGTTVSIGEAESIEEVTFNDESVDGTVSVNEYTELPEGVAAQVTRSIAEDIDPNRGTQSESNTVAEQNSNENQDGSTTSESTDADTSSVETDDSATAADDTSSDSINVVSMVDISPSSDSAAETGATVTLTVDSDAVNSPSSVFITHETDQGWEQLETTVESQSNEKITLSAPTGSFSLFAVVETTDTVQSDGSADATDSPDNPSDYFPIPLIIAGLLIVGIASSIVFWLR
jgi:PGF-pre-PGF domain-containing protein